MEEFQEPEVEIAPATLVAREMRKLQSEITPKIEIDMEYINEMKNQTSSWRLPEPVEIPADAIMTIDQLDNFLSEPNPEPKKKKRAKSTKPKAKKKKKTK